MHTKQVPYNNIKNAINIAFDKDNKIVDLYDPSVKVFNTIEVASNVYHKGTTYILQDIKTFEVYEKNKIIGYFYFCNKVLLSFGLNVMYRKQKYLAMFFSKIKKEIGHKFYCFLYDCNIRAIKWLVKMGMKICLKNYNHNGSLITALKY